MSKEEEGKSSEGKDEGKDGEEGKSSAPFDDEAEIKLILLGDSAVGKTKMVERFLMDEYNPQQVRLAAEPAPPRSAVPRAPRPPARDRDPPPTEPPPPPSQLSTYALTLFRKVVDIDDRKVSVGASPRAPRPPRERRAPPSPRARRASDPPIPARAPRRRHLGHGGPGAL